MRYWYGYLLAAVALVCGTAHAQESASQTQQAASANQLFIGPQWYWQTADLQEASPAGSLWGATVQFDHQRCCSYYLGASASWATGSLANGVGRDINSDWDVQGRMGYTFCLSLCGRQFLISPYAGFGYRELDTKFSINDVTVSNDYHRYYAPIGFKANLFACECWDVGLNAQARIDIGTFQFIGSTSSLLESKVGVLVELPITYHLCSCSPCGFDIRLTPFFKWDGYGQPENLETPQVNFDVYDAGLQLMVGYRW